MYPFVKQEGIKDCAAASLKMIIKYYHGNLNINYLNELLKTTKKGTNAYNLVEAAKEIGFDSYGCKYDSINKMVGINLPVIAHLKIDNAYFHYVVIYKIDLNSNTLVIGDPAKGILKVTFSKFNELWTNIVIVLNPLRNIMNLKEQSLLDFVFKYFIKNIKTILYIFIYAFISTILLIITSFYLQNMLLAINLINNKEHLMFLLTIFLILSVLKIITDYFKTRVIIKLATIIDLDLTIASISKIIHLPYNYFYNHTIGEIASKVSDLSIVKNFISKVTLNLIIDMLVSLISLISLYLISDKLFIIALISIFLYVLILYLFKTILNKKVINNQEKRSIVNSYLIESLNGYETNNNLNIKSKVINTFSDKYYKSTISQEKLNLLYTKEYYIKELISVIAYLFVIYFGSILVINNNLTIGSLLTYSILFNYFINPFKELIDMNLNMNEANSAFKRLMGLFYDNNQVLIDYKLDGNINIKDLSFTYDNGQEILKNINLDIKVSDKILLVGPSGTGKSTLLKLLIKYYEVEDDMIYFNNIDTNLISNESLHNSVTLVSQKEILYTDTILNNLMITNNSMKNIFKIANICEILPIIKKHNGYNTLIEEDGSNISGGEKQRIILARALLKNSSIYLLDEATSELNYELERKIIANVFNYFKKQTFIVVSHSVKNMDLFNRVFEIKEDGHIYELYGKK